MQKDNSQDQTHQGSQLGEVCSPQPLKRERERIPLCGQGNLSLHPSALILSRNPGRKHISCLALSHRKQCTARRNRRFLLGKSVSRLVGLLGMGAGRGAAPSLLPRNWRMPSAPLTEAHLVSNLAVGNEISPQITIKWNT